MAIFCDNSCAPPGVAAPPAFGCTPLFRNKAFSRLVFINCKVDRSLLFPTSGDEPVTAEDVIENLATLYAADGAFVWDAGTREMTIGENSYLVNDTVASVAWQVLNVGAGYSGGSSMTGTGSSFTLLNVGLDDDFIIQLTVTTASGLVSTTNMLFGQNGEVPDQDLIIRTFFLAVTNAGTELAFLTTYSIPVNTYVYPVTADEVGLDADNSATYEQVCDAALIPCNFIHDYGNTGFYTGTISVSILDSVPPPPGADTYTGFGFGFVRCQYALSLT